MLHAGTAQNRGGGSSNENSKELVIVGIMPKIMCVADSWSFIQTHSQRLVQLLAATGVREAPTPLEARTGLSLLALR